MNRREARCLVLRRAAAELFSDIDNGSGWISEDDHGEPYSEADIKRMERAVRELCEQLWRASERLGGEPAPEPVPDGPVWVQLPLL